MHQAASEMTIALRGCNETPIISYVFIHMNLPCFSCSGGDSAAIPNINPRFMWSPGTLSVVFETRS